MMKPNDIDGLMQAVAGVMSEYIADALRPINDAIKQLRDDTAAGRELRYCGTWQRSSSYARGNFVTYAGSLWHCNRSTDVSPGDGKDWTLAVKRGSDAK